MECLPNCAMPGRDGTPPATASSRSWAPPRGLRETDRMPQRLSYSPATADRWDDVRSLFGPNGAYSNCWCTWWILTGPQFDRATPEERRSVLEALCAEGSAPGILAYEEDRPVGWVAVGPRERYARMMSPRARVNGPLDFADPGWVVNCFYIPTRERGHGIASGLLGEAVGFAFDRGANYVTGHPIDVEEGAGPGAAGLFVGTLSMFLRAGFVEVERRGGRPVVRIDPHGYREHREERRH